MDNEEIIGGKFSIDISELSAGLRQANKLINLSNSEFKAATSDMDKWQESTDGITAKLKNLNKVEELQSEKVRALTEEYEKVSAEKGKTSREAVDLEIKLNKEKATLGKTQLEIKKYTESLNDTTRQSKELSTQINSLESEYADLVKEQGKSSEEAKSLKSNIDNLKAKYKDLDVQINNTETETKDLDDTQKGLTDGFTVMKGAMANLIADGFKKLLDITVENIKQLATFTNDYDKTMNKLTASTGATSQEMEHYETVMDNLYKSNYGESLEDVGNALSIVVQNARDLDPSKIEEMTKNAILLRDVFDYDYTESMRAVNMLIDTFGMSGEEAFNLISQGAQNGLDKNKDLLDTVNEYSVHFSQLGFDSEEFFGMLYNGSRDGTFSMDKLGDAVKEFGIRVKDESKTTTEAYEILNLDADKMRKSFLAGGDEAKDAFQKTVEALMKVEDPIKRNTAGVGLFGTMFEDLGIDAIKNLSNTRAEFDMTSDTIANIDDVIKNDVGNTWQELGRKIQINVLKPLGEKLLPILQKVIDNFIEWQETVDWDTFGLKAENAINDLVDGFKKAIDVTKKIMDITKKYLPVITGITGAIIAYKVATVDMQKGNLLMIATNKIIKTSFSALKAPIATATVSFKAFTTALKANAVFLVISAVVGLVTALTSLAKKQEEVQIKAIKKEFFDGQGTSIDTLTEKIKSSTDAYSKMNNKVIDLGEELKNNREDIDTAVSDLDYFMTELGVTGNVVSDEQIPKIVQAFETLKNGVKTNLELSSQLIVTLLKETVAGATKEASDEMGILINKVLEYKGLMGTELDEITEKMQPFLDKMSKGEALTDEEKSVFMALYNQAAALDVKVSETQTKWNEAIKGLDKIDFGGNVEEAEKQIENLKTLGETLLGELNDSSNTAYNEVETNVARVKALFENGVIDEATRDEMLGTWEQVRIVLDESFANQEADIKNQLATSVQTIRDSLKEQLEEQIPTAIEEMGGFKKGWIKFFSFGSTEEKVLQNEAKKAIEKNIENPINEKLTEMEESLGIVGYDIGSYTGTEFGKGVKSSVPTVTSSFELLPKEGTSIMQGSVAEFRKAGKNLIIGAKEGIENKEEQNKAYTSVRNFGNNLLYEFKGSLKEQSPSKATKTMGINLLKGLEIGIEKEEDTVINKIKRMSKSIVDTFQNNLDEVKVNVNATASLGSNSIKSNGIIGTENVSNDNSKTVNFYQTNNSPKSLNRLEIYRQTKNAATKILVE